MVDVAHIRAGAYRWEQAGWLLGHPFAALVPELVGLAASMMGFAASGRSGSIRTRDHAVDEDVRGGHDLHDPRPTGTRGEPADADSREGRSSARTCPSRNA